MNVVYEEFTEKFRIVGNLYKCICYLEKIEQNLKYIL